MAYTLRELDTMKEIERQRYAREMYRNFIKVAHKKSCKRKQK